MYGQGLHASLGGVVLSLLHLVGNIALASFPADTDGDRDADLRDLERILDCLSGPGVDPSTACTPADLDPTPTLVPQARIDLRDFAAFQNAYSTGADFRELLDCFEGPAVNPATACNVADYDPHTILEPRTHVDLRDVAAFQIGFAPATRLTSASPSNGEPGVALTRETIIDFSHPVVIVQDGAFAVVAASQPIAGHHVISGDGNRIWFFYEEELPGSTEITVTVDGSAIVDERGLHVDGDGDGSPGGVHRFSFTTLSVTTVGGTTVRGRIFDSALTEKGTNIPLQGVTLTVEGRPDLVAVTDKMGNFELINTPAGRFFVHLDGATEVKSQGLGGPLDYYYPTLGKPFENIKPGVENVMPFDTYLPKVMKADVMTQIDPAKEIVVAPDDPALMGIEVTIAPGSLFREDGTPATFVGLGVVPPDRLPGPLPQGVDPPLVFTFQTDATNLRVPASVRFPNLDGLPPGAKPNLFSFNHDVGRFELAGPMTVDATGKFIETDAGVGIPAPGWHFPCDCQDGGDCKPDCPSCDSLYLGRMRSEECCEKICYEESLYFRLVLLVCFGAGHTPVGHLACHIALECVNHKVRECLECDIAAVAAGQNFSEQILPLITQWTEVTTPFAASGQPLDESAIARIEEIIDQMDEISGGDAFETAERRAISAYVEWAEAGFAHRSDDSDRTIPFLVSLVPLAADATPTFLRSTTSEDGKISFLYGRDYSVGSVILFDPIVWSIGTSVTISESQDRLQLSGFSLTPISENAPDFDGDGLPDIVEIVVGTSIAQSDTDKDGLPDGAEVRAGTDPADGGFAVTGIVGAIDTQGFAHEVCARNDLAFVADGAEGLSVFNVFKPSEPALVIRVDTPGTAVDVDCGDELVAVADAAAGLAIIDITSPPNAHVARQVSLPGGAEARCVSVVLDTAYVGDSVGRVHLVGMSSGVLLGTVNVAAGAAIDDLGVNGSTLFAVTTAASGGSGELVALGIGPELPAIRHRIAANHSNERTGPYPRRRLFAGVTHALVSDFGGFSGFDIRDPANLTPTCTNQLLTAVRGVTDNGSGAVTLASGTSDNADAQLYGGFPPACDTAITAYTTPGNAHGVAMHNGLVYLADGVAGLQIINIISTDVKGIAPTGTLMADAVGGTVTEGGRVHFLADVQDDIQVRNVEFFVDGQRATIDGNFPFEFDWPVPLGLPGSVVSFTATARDTGGNALELGPIDLTIVADTQPPVVTFVQPTPGQVFFAGDEIIVRIAATDDVGVESVAFRIDGVNTPATRRSLDTWQIDAPNALRTYVLTASASDPSGNSGVSPPVSFDVLGEAISREFSVYNAAFDEPASDAVSREFSVFNNPMFDIVVDAMSREFSVFNQNFDGPAADAVSREFSIFNILDEMMDAISREFSVHNGESP
jgi:hypothetical protein